MPTIQKTNLHNFGNPTNSGNHKLVYSQTQKYNQKP